MSVEEGRQARDVMTFGQELGRVLSDGRIVGRAEPFAKVFPSSRAVKRAVGVAAWAVLEDIALDARIDGRGRLVADTNVRRIAANLGLNKETVSRHLGHLRTFGFVLQEEERDTASGRYRSSRYVIDPTACIERFTHTPSRPRKPRPENPDTAPRPTPPDAADTGQGEPGRQEQEEEPEEQPQLASDGDELRGKLRQLGVESGVAARLVACSPAQRVEEALEVSAAEGINDRAAWVVQALRAGWDLGRRRARAQVEALQRQRECDLAEVERAADDDSARRRENADGWARAVSAALDHEALAHALGQVARPLPGLDRLSVPVARAQLLTWAVQVHIADVDRPLADSLLSALRKGAQPTDALEQPWPPPPAAGADTADLNARIAACLDASMAAPSTSIAKEHG